MIRDFIPCPKQLNIFLKSSVPESRKAMTIPEKPTSGKQRYITTEIGKEALKTWKNF